MASAIIFKKLFLRGKAKFLDALIFTKYDKRLCRSLRKIGIRMGPFATATKHWKVVIIYTAVECTMNLLLTF